MSGFPCRTKEYGCRRFLLCLLLAAVVLSVFAGTGECEAEITAFNFSGNRNVELSVDPIWKSEGFSAVLYDNSNGMPTSAANAIAQTEDGFLWIGSYAGLIRYEGNSFERIGSTMGIANIRALFTDSRDRLWIGTNDAGVFVMKNGEFRHFGKADGLPSVSIRAFAEDEKGVIYVSCASAGLIMIDDAYKLTALQDERIALQSTTLRQSEDGNVYGLTQGGDLFTVRGGEITFFLSAEESRIKNIISILPDPTRPGCLYVSTGSSRIYYGNPERNFTAMNLKNIASLTSVVSMEYIDGRVWVCAGNGIGVLDSTGFHQLQNVPMTNNIEHVMTDYEGNLWFTSSRQGVMKIVPNHFADLFARYGLPAAVVDTTCLYEKQLFIGTDTGLIVTENGSRLNSLPLARAVTASGEELEATDIVRFGDSISIILDRATFEHQSILKQYDLSLEMYRKYYQYEQIKGAFRETVSLIPEEAFREAIANALVHRTWGVNANINISMFADRIDIISPGGLPKGISEEEYLRGGISILRNRIIGNVFLRLQMIEKFGTGIRRIYESYKESSIKPLFEVTESSIRISLPVIQINNDLSADENKVFSLLKGKLLSSSMVAEATGFGKSKTVSILNSLAKEGYIRVLGNGRGTKYTAD